MASNAKKYVENGVLISKDKIKAGDKITLTYEGLLAKSGAELVIAHFGYGDEWEDKAYIQMEPVDGSFKLTFIVIQSKDLNVTFKDGADNWDNNSGNNYTFLVSDKAKEPKKADLKKTATVEKKPAKSPKAKKQVSAK